MGLIDSIKSALGLADSGRRSHGTDVTVERTADASNERAVKESEPASSDADADGSSEVDRIPDAESESNESVETIKGIGPAYADRLADAGVETVGDLAGADAAALDAATDIGAGRLETWIERAES